MSSRVSPFAALTGAEKQIRWLEYQSIPLPYVQGSVEPIAIQNDIKEEDQPRHVKTKDVDSAVSPLPHAPSEPKPAPVDFQKTRHSQYDAVIARMKQAEKGVRFYQALS